jgi:hypothetical protein
LKPGQKRDLLTQVGRGAKLRVLLRKPRERDNFGVYGQIAVGTLDPTTCWNAVNFDADEVANRFADFLILWERAQTLTAEMLGIEPS